jgi:hypothetical protein
MPDAPDPPAILETPQHSAQKSRIQIKLSLQIVREAGLLVRNLEQDPSFRQSHPRI